MSSSKVLTVMNEKLIADMDKVAANESRSRSSLVRQAVRIYLSRRGFPEYAVIASPGKPGASANQDGDTRSN